MAELVNGTYFIFERGELMNEITDPNKLYNIQRAMPMLGLDPNVQYKIYKAWELSSNHEDGYGEWYQVEIVDQRMMSFKGMLDIRRGTLYLDIQATLAFVDERIMSHLDTFNAGHHWRYKGV